MQRKTILILVCLLAGGCSFSDFKFKLPGVYKLDIPQGNIVKQEMVDQLQPGMTKRQVRFVMGTPLVIDTFDQNRWDYLHSYERRGSPLSQTRLSLFFDNDKLVRISGDYAPSGSAEGIAAGASGAQAAVAEAEAAAAEAQAAAAEAAAAANADN